MMVSIFTDFSCSTFRTVHTFLTHFILILCNATIVHVLGKTRSSVAALKEVVELCGDDADYVVVKNLLFGEPHTFVRYDASQTRKKVVEQLGGIELNMRRCTI
jgi:hypothetical protein